MMYRSRRGKAGGSIQRSLGLMAATCDWIAFADDDVWWEKNRSEIMLTRALEHSADVVFTHRHIWAPPSLGEEGCTLIGEDRFESVGPQANLRKVPYEMIDNNCMIIRGDVARGAAALYAATDEYNDDRLFYSYLKAINAKVVLVEGSPLHQVCPLNLVPFFKEHCTPVTTEPAMKE